MNTEQARKKLNAYIKNNDTFCLNIGSGGKLFKNWLNLDKKVFRKDVLVWDLNDNFSFCEDNIFDYIYSEHVLEHFSKSAGINILKESFRILKPNGVLRLALPGLDFIISEYNSGNSGKFKSVCELVNACFYMYGHKYLYDYDELADSLSNLGFKIVTRQKYHESNHKHLKKIETRISYQSSLIVEAVK